MGGEGRGTGKEKRARGQDLVLNQNKVVRVRAYSIWHHLGQVVG